MSHHHEKSRTLHDQLDSVPDQSDGERAERAETMTAIATAHVGALIEAVQDNGVRWEDVCFGVGMGMRAFAEVVAQSVRHGQPGTDGTPLFSPEQALALVQHLLQQGMATTVHAFQCSSAAEAEALREKIESGQAPH